MALTLDSLTTNLVKGGKRLFDLSDDLAKYKLLTRKVSTLMNIWILGIDLMRLGCLQ